MPDTAEIFNRNRYVFLGELLKEPAVSLHYRYARKLADIGRMQGDEASDKPGALWLYADLMMEGLLHELLPKIESASQVQLFPTYSYLRIYSRGHSLARHTDRPSCEISVSLCLGFDGPSPWPLSIEGPYGVSNVILQPGDALLYRGIECPHWRDPLDGDQNVQLFLHYVDRNGPFAEWKYDKRESL